MVDSLGAFEFTVAGKRYKATRGNAEDQFDLLSKLTPLLASGIGEIIPFLMEVRRNGITNIGDVAMERIGQITTPVARELSNMSRKDRQVIVAACLRLCQRKGDGEAEGWADVWNDGAQMSMFADIHNDIGVMLQIVWAVIQGVFGRFFPESVSRSFRK